MYQHAIPLKNIYKMYKCNVINVNRLRPILAAIFDACMVQDDLFFFASQPRGGIHWRGLINVFQHEQYIHYLSLTLN